MGWKLRVAHIITDLDVGGSELVLTRLVEGMDPARFTQQVISLKPAGVVAEPIQQAGIAVKSLEMAAGFPDPTRLLKLANLLRSFKPDVLQTWMYHADLAGGLAARLAGRFPVIWGIRNNALILDASKPRTVRIARQLARFSKWLPYRIVSCSIAAQAVHVGLGYSPGKFVVIPNGFDLKKFKPDPAARRDVRNELGLDGGAQLVGLVARFDPNKDHQNFIQAARILLERQPGVHFVLCGEGITPGNPALVEWISQTGREGNFHLLGRRPDIPRLTASLDAACSSSFSEAFPNVVGEAMACGIPVAATDAGDTAFLMGDTGQPVPPRSPRDLAGALERILTMSPQERSGLATALRRRIEEHFSLESMILRYQDLYEQAALSHAKA